MSGPNPPDPGPDGPGPDSVPATGLDDGLHADASVDSDRSSATPFYPQAYSAPESEQFTGGPFVPMDLDLYDYDNYEEIAEEPAPPRWPWVVGVAAIVAAVALVVSVSLLFARTDTNKLATPGIAPTSTPPIQDEITVTTPPPAPAPSPAPPTSQAPPPPPATSEEPPPPPPPPTSEEPPPPPATTAPPATTTAAAPPPTPTTTPAGPKQVTYSVTGTKAPFDQITITYTDASGQRRVQRNAYIPWSLTLTPISQSDVGFVEASSLLRLSKLNCTITSSDGTVLSANENNAPQTSC
ncbi:MmpS family transport accessory protein [Mycobacterium sp.]|uniref:MmpS family transport accessory protein n=1 Tax=Mycobacterium sp. TaxID=1785 RepID=UPI00128AC17D|nr:MmpS family transport accessory protein [Mycobacterium sp.]KAA8969323.1 MAG: hypothetical protein F6Q13_03435 [Mycobacterium sp.]